MGKGIEGKEDDREVDLRVTSLWNYDLTKVDSENYVT